MHAVALGVDGQRGGVIVMPGAAGEELLARAAQGGAWEELQDGGLLAHGLHQVLGQVIGQVMREVVAFGVGRSCKRVHRTLTPG